MSIITDIARQGVWLSKQSRREIIHTATEEALAQARDWASATGWGWQTATNPNRSHYCADRADEALARVEALKQRLNTIEDDWCWEQIERRINEL